MVARARARLHAAGRVRAAFQFAVEHIGVAVHTQGGRGQAQGLQGAAVRADQHVPLKRQQAFTRRAQAGRIGMQAQHGVVLVGFFEQPVFDHIHGRAHQGQHIRANVACLAGQVQHSQHAPFTVGDGHGRAGQDAIGFKVVFRAMHGDGPAFDQRGADGVGAGRGLVPGRAGHQRHAGRAAGESRIAIAVQHQPLRVRQDHQVAIAAGLAAQVGHGGFGQAAQRFVALLGFAQFALRHEFSPAHATHVKAQVGTTPPGSQDGFSDDAAGHRPLLVEQQARLRQRVLTGLTGHACLLGRVFCDTCSATTSQKTSS
ncbi:hypothetical protein D3C85_874620 [compost metagenome]